MGISGRLKYIASLVTPGSVVADIGTDHGFVPAYLIKQGICTKTIASDLSQGSLDKAIELSSKLEIEDKMECRLSDGLDKITPGEADSIIISGMGGILMTEILSKHPEVLAQTHELILSPHRDSELVRTFLNDHNFNIVSDEEITDKKKRYTVIKAVNKALV